MQVIKRDESLEDFDSNKIEQAILKAMKNGSGIIKPKIAKQIAHEIQHEFEYAGKTEVRECVIEAMVFSKLVEKKQGVTARRYEGYRAVQEYKRKRTKLDKNIEGIVNGTNEEVLKENSNKAAEINSTQRDLIAGEFSKDYTDRVLLPDDILAAHEEGIIHFHDKDYFISHIHNCFSGDTEFVTDEGIRKFKDCLDGEIVNVVDKDGNWKEATVHKYGKQKMKDVTFIAGRSKKTVTCTANHRWILSDGTVTTSLKKGDSLLALPEMNINTDIVTKEDAKNFCLGFVIGDGTDHVRTGFHLVRLCGNKSQYADIFRMAGYKVSVWKSADGDFVASKKGIIKQDFLTSASWRFMSAQAKKMLFLGYYAADGHMNGNDVATTDERILDMIKSTSVNAGYYISSIKEKIRDTNYKKDSLIYNIRFRKHQNYSNHWIVKSIKKHSGDSKIDAWCVEEPTTMTFTLNNGMVTGNCSVINLEDMLQNGTVISGTLIEKPHSFRTACTVVSQIVAQVASNQFGGQTWSLAHIAPFVDISRQKFRAEVYEEQKEIGGATDTETINKIAEMRLKKEIEAGIQTITYQLYTLLTTNGQTPFVTIHMYINEVPEGQLRDDLVSIIVEVLKQRIKGLKNEDGVYITPAFPKLIYITQDNNIYPDSEYYWVTELAAKCTAKRLVPDYISEKKMLELKGDVYPIMGCRAILTPDRFTDAGKGNIANAKNYVPGKHKYYGRLTNVA